MGKAPVGASFALQQWTGSTAYSMYLVVAMYVLAGLILVAVHAAKTTEQRPA